MTQNLRVAQWLPTTTPLPNYGVVVEDDGTGTEFAPINLPGPTGPAGPTGPQGAPGVGTKGDKGDVGPANELTIDSVVTGAPGTPADANISGTPPAQQLSLVIPQGLPGAKGDQGDKGDPGDPGGLTDGDMGDITVSGGGTALTIDPQAVTYAKIQDLSAARLLGNPSGIAGAVREITLGTNLSFSGTTLNAAGGGGGLTDGDKGDITVGGGGTTLTIDAQAVSYAKIQDVTAARLVGNPSGTLGALREITLGTNLSFSGTTLNAAGGGGGTPGGSTNQVQYNNAGAFAGSVDLTWDNGNRTLTLGSSASGGGGTIKAPQSVTTPTLTLQGGTFATGGGGQCTVSGGPSATAGQWGGHAVVQGGPGLGSGGAGSGMIRGGTSPGAGEAGNVDIIGGVNSGAGPYGWVQITTTNTERLRILANGAWSVGNLGNQTGTVGQPLLSSGPSAPPAWGTALRLGDGSVAAPSYAFTNNTDMGFYRAGANTIALSTGGTLRWSQSSTQFLLATATQLYLGDTASPQLTTNSNRPLTIKAGNSISVRADASVIAGDGNSFAAGVATLRGGTMVAGNLDGGAAVVEGGTGTNATGGGVTIQSAAGAACHGGNIAITAAAGVGTNKNGGNITITAGAATGTGVPGSVSIVAASYLLKSGVMPGVTYGSYYVSGSSAGYHGIGVDDGTLRPILMSNGTAAGINVTGDAKWLLYRASINDANSGYIITAPAFNPTSSRALKDETGVPSGVADILSRLRPLLYRLKEGYTNEQLGLVAEEVHEICPYLSDGKTVCYDRLALLLLADWQAQRGIRVEAA